MIVYLNGQYLPLEKAQVSILDRGFLFADGVYEVVPVYDNCPFRLEAHLSRLAYSLKAVDIKQPHSKKEWKIIINTLITQHITQYQQSTLSVYIQITRGTESSRKHIGQEDLTPSVLVMTKSLNPFSFDYLMQPHLAVSAVDIRWHRCDIKSIALLGNILLLQQAKKNQAKEVILIRDNQVTEGASSNVFMVKDGAVFTHPADKHILSGITRDVVIESVKIQNIPLHQIHFSFDDLLQADEIWISSSTKELMPITHLNQQVVGQGKAGKIWHQIYKQFQAIKTCELN